MQCFGMEAQTMLATSGDPQLSKTSEKADSSYDVLTNKKQTGSPIWD